MIDPFWLGVLYTLATAGALFGGALIVMLAFFVVVMWIEG